MERKKILAKVFPHHGVRLVVKITFIWRIAEEVKYYSSVVSGTSAYYWVHVCFPTETWDDKGW